MAGRFAGRCAVVTGGVSGIGAGIAARLASEGAKLSLWDRDAGTLGDMQARSRGATHTVAVDVSDAEAVRDAAAETVRAMGRIDILIASAGITGPNATVAEYPIDAWNRVINVNLNGVFYCNRAVVPHMQKSGYGRIVNIASIGGKHGAPEQAHYSASKAAIMGFTRVLAQEVGKYGITANCVCPGIIYTDMGRTNLDDPAVQAQWVKVTALGRVGQPEDVVGAVCFFASDASAFITGQSLNVCGGIVLS